MTIAHVSDADYAAIGKAYSEYIVEHGKGSVPAGDWPDVLGAALFKRAVEGGFFGPSGNVSGLDYSVGTVKGAQVRGVSSDDGGIDYTLYVDGVPTATEHGDGDFDTVAFAKRHGQDI